MARARPSARRPAARRTPAPPPLRSADSLLLELARSVDALARDPAEVNVLPAALARLEEAYGRHAELPRALAESWLHTRNDKAAVLALAWAREQLRLALLAVIQREAGRGRVRTDLSPDAAAWLLLAGSEAMAHEPPGAAPDRTAMLLELLRPG